MDDFVSDLLLFVDKLHISEAIFVGMSLGAAVALKFALAHPTRVNRIVMLEGISVEGFPPFMRRNPNTNLIERITDVDVVRQKQKSVEKNLRDRNKDFIRIFYAGGVLSHAQNKIHPSDIDFLLDEVFRQRNYE